MKSLFQTILFTIFTLTEYIRSGRILAEAVATLGCLLLFFRNDGVPPPPEYFFSIAGTFTLVLCFYTASAILSLGDRPQGYVVLAHGLGRGSYLLGLYCAVVGVVTVAYLALSIGVAILNPVDGIRIGGWLLGTLPLLLNVALLSALLTLLTPMVLSAGWRLTALALVAIAFSGNLISGPTLAALPVALATTLDVLRTIFSAPLLPAFTGFALSVSRDYSGISMIVPVSQFFLTCGTLALAIYVFSRREVMFSPGT